MKQAYLSNWYYVDVARVPQEVIDVALTVIPKSYDEDAPREPMLNYDLSHDGYIGLPIDWGLKYYYDENYEDRTSVGQPWFAPNRPDPAHPRAAAGQAKFISDLRDAMDNYHTVLAIAPTGSGKTVSCLSASADRGRSTLVILPSTQILKQWKEAAIDHLGMDKSDIGLIQGDKCQYERPLCLGMVHSLAKREYPEELYSAFGTVVWDEVHRVAAQSFSKTIGLFDAEVRVGLTATPERRDGTKELFIKSFGNGQVKSTASALPIDVHVLNYEGFMPEWAEDDHNLRVGVLASDERRNRLIVDCFMRRRAQGHRVLLVSDHIDHIEMLFTMIRAAGVPANELGQFTGEYTEKGARLKTSDSYLAWCKLHARHVGSTYQMMKEGVDIPQLSAGMDCTPRSDATQLIGRVRRPMAKKVSAVWDTIRDNSCGPLVGYFMGRMRDYRSDKNVRIIYATRTNTDE